MIHIGVLALQGAFIEHIKMLRALDVDGFEIRKKSDLQKDCDGLILPGGESTVIGPLLADLGLMEPIRDAIQCGLPAFGTCAGLILLAKKIGNEGSTYLATMDIDVIRNGYGRQLGSFTAISPFLNQPLEMRFIRAPYIEKTGKNVKILATVDQKIVAAQQENQLVTAFHPELTKDPTVHRHFLHMIESAHKAQNSASSRAAAII
jgi:5'-phosphate synthase pdxT subunit